MDAFLECYFNRVFSKMERGNLLERYKRREMIDYFQNVITGCCQAGQCDPQLGCRMAVDACLRHHEASKRGNGAVCLKGKHHGVLYVAAKLAFDGRLDAPIVARLLDAIFSCEGSFEKLFVGAVFGTKAAALMVGWKSDFDSREESIHALDFFLDHATRARLTYPFNGEQVRVVDYPMESCGYSTPLRTTTQLFKPDVLRVLLKYGASIPEDEDGNVPAMKHMLGGLYRFLLESRTPWDSPAVPQDVVKCLKLLFRAVAVARLPLRSDASREHLREVLRTHDVIAPARCGLEPPELKHLCRCVVRQELNRNWQLPRGISTLNVPATVQEYLDLKED